MAPKRQQREYSAAELAMIDDIGAGRVDKLPMEDSGMVPRGGAALTNIESRRTGTQNSWNDAIKRGVFEDEDAAFVVGQQELANGSLARMRRAADLSYMAVNRSYDFNDGRLRKNRNGQVAPQAQFSRGGRGPSRAGLTHTGDGPVELRGSAHHGRQSPGRVTTITAQRPRDPSRGRISSRVVPSTHVAPNSSSPSSPAAQPTAVIVQTNGPQEDIQVRTTTMQFHLPDGYSVLFQAPVTFASPAFIDRTGEYPGTIYLINGPLAADDQIILHVNEDRVEDVKRRTKEYVDYLSDSDRLILQFKDEADCITWFVVIFRQRDVMVSFVSALRDFIDRLKEPIPSPVVTPAVSIEPTRDAPVPSAGDRQQADTMRTVSAAILEDIVSWAIHIVDFIRDAGPAELQHSDALPGIIRGASAAVLMEKHAGFSGLDSKQRVAFVDQVCVPQVDDRFKRRMLLRESTTGDAHSTGTSPDVQEIVPAQSRRPKYTMEKLIQLHCKAIAPPAYLAELRYLPEITPENRVWIHEVIQRVRGVQSRQTPVQAAQTPEHPTPQIQTAPEVLISTPCVTVTTAPTISTPEEPLVAIHGEMNGLNSSRHNLNGGDVLGKVAGQFTGVLANDQSHLADLMQLDGMEDFDVIRAQDPEVAEIADRFARVSFDEK